MRRLRHIKFACLLTGLLVLAACAGTAQPSKPDATEKIASPVPADYTRVGVGDLRDPGKINIITDFAVIDGDAHAQVVFPISLSAALSDARPDQRGSSGNGLSADEAIKFSTTDGEDELRAAANYLASQFKERRSIFAELYRSEAKHYVMLLAFETENGARSRYFDVTAWVRSVEAPFNN